MRELILTRHAKSEWNHLGLSDLERPLNARGKRDAPFMGRRLAEALGSPPDLIVSSPATRALHTALAFAEALGYPARRIELEPRIYEAPLAALLAVLQTLPDAAPRVCLFGHNPGFSMLVDCLTDAGYQTLPTCATARITFDIDTWAALSPSSGHLQSLDFPKRHFGGEGD
jgi:phosphohistidine phosphatase